MSYRDLFGIRMKPDASTPASMPTLNANEPPGRVEDQEIVEAARVMEQKQVRRLPVMDRTNHLVGVISLGDLAVRDRHDGLAGEVLERVSEQQQVIAHEGV